MKRQPLLQNLEGSGIRMSKRPLTLPILEIFGPTFQGEGRAIEDVITTVLGVILPLLGMVPKNLDA